MTNSMHLAPESTNTHLLVRACPTEYCTEDNPLHPGTVPTGVLERGRALCTVQNGVSKCWDEWQFVPNDIREDAGPVRDTPTAAIDARSDARTYVRSLSL